LLGAGRRLTYRFRNGVRLYLKPRIDIIGCLNHGSKVLRLELAPHVFELSRSGRYVQAERVHSPGTVVCRGRHGCQVEPGLVERGLIRGEQFRGERCELVIVRRIGGGRLRKRIKRRS
jgi:hypothetical protein